MPLNRKQIARAANTRKKFWKTRETRKKTSEFNAVCEKHSVGILSFKSCKMAAPDGAVTLVEYDEIRGNMRSGILIVKANTLVKSDTTYDIVQIENDKKARDLKKYEEEMAKVKIEMERLKNQETIDVGDSSAEHKDLLMKLVNQAEETQVVQDVPSETIQTVSPENQEPVDNEDDIPDLVSSDSDGDEKNVEEKNVEEKKDKDEVDEDKVDEDKVDEEKKDGVDDKSVSAKRKKALDKFKEEIDKKSNPTENRNKHYRNFMKSLRDKFTLEQQSNIKFFEVRKEATDMIIDNAIVYRIKISDKCDDTYLLIIGDLQLKSGLIRQIDPSYNVDQVIKEQYDFLERIKAKENAKILEAQENIIHDEEFDELEDIGLSDDDDKNNETPSDSLVDTKNDVLCQEKSD